MTKQVRHELIEKLGYNHFIKVYGIMRNEYSFNIWSKMSSDEKGWYKSKFNSMSDEELLACVLSDGKDSE